MSNYDMSDYVDVAERIREFRAVYPQGVLRPWNPDKPFEIVQVGERMFIVYTAAAYRSPDDPMPAVAVAWEPALGKTNFTRDSELMNAETSAWGRAIVAALVSDTKRIASANEVRNRRADTPETVADVLSEINRASEKPAPKPQAARSPYPPTEKQRNFIKSLMKQTDADEALVASLAGAPSFEALDSGQAKQVIEALLKLKDGNGTLVFDNNGKASVQ